MSLLHISTGPQTASCKGELDLPYRRFLALRLVGEGAPTQRVLAERLGVTEPSRARLALTPIGKARVEPAGISSRPASPSSWRAPV